MVNDVHGVFAAGVEVGIVVFCTVEEVILFLPFLCSKLKKVEETGSIGCGSSRGRTLA